MASPPGVPRGPGSSIKLVFVCVESMTHVTNSDLGDCRICARLHDLSEILEHKSPSGHLALQV